MKLAKKTTFVSKMALLVLIVFNLPTYAENEKEPIEHLTFEGSLIEGQMGTLQALIVTSEKRPEFGPMALQLGNKQIELKNINKNIVEENQYKEAFKVQLPD